MTRIPYYSAMTALDAHDGEGGDWLDLAEFARSMGCDLHELWRRAMFGAAIGNCDDHLRNHGSYEKTVHGSYLPHSTSIQSLR